eukprot:1085915-Pelagomonas_calceolata.AAC.4
MYINTTQTHTCAFTRRLSALPPSFQLRMSKKVAQLTKVIYHLNSKNEDHDLDMQDLAEQYEAELELVLKDTTEKVNFFKLKLEEASDEKRVREVARGQTAYELPSFQGREADPELAKDFIACAGNMQKPLLQRVAQAGSQAL